MARTSVIKSLTLESGIRLRNVPVAYQTWGTLNPAADNVIVVGHSLTSATDVSDWWAGCIGRGKALDTDRYFIVCANVIGSPYGSVAPVSRDPATREPYGLNLPQATVRDTVALHKALLDSWRVRQVAMVIGGSMGGMQALEWAFYGPDYVRGIVPIGVGGRHSSWCIAWSESQRQAIFADPEWQNGRYDPKTPPSAGLAAARMVAMISYRSFGSFEKKFGRERAGNGDFNMESWLRHHGDKLVRRFDPACYVYLTRLMDSHDVSRGRGPYESVLQRIRQHALVIGIRSDVLYLLAESEELAEHMPNSELAVMEGSDGHDTFLIDQASLNETVLAWRKRVIDPLVLHAPLRKVAN